MSSIIQSFEGASNISLCEQRSCLQCSRSSQKTNKNRHNFTGNRPPKLATAVQRSTPIACNPLMLRPFLMKLAASHGES
jgi:hypothetical protein